MTRRSIGLPLALGIVLAACSPWRLARRLAAARRRGVGARPVAERLSPALGAARRSARSSSLLVIAGGLVLLCAWLVREMRLNQRQQAFLDAVTHEMKTPLAVAAALPRDARSPRSDRRAAPRTSSARMREDVERLERTVDQVLAAARAEARARRAAGARARRPARSCSRRSCARRPAAARARAGRGAPRATAIAPARGDASELGAGLPQPARERRQVLRARRSRCASASAIGRATAACASRSPTAASASRASELRKIFQRFYRAGRDVQRQRAGLGLGPLHRAQPGAPPGRPRRGAQRGAGRGSRFVVTLRAAPPASGLTATSAAGGVQMARDPGRRGRGAPRRGAALQPRGGGPRGGGRGRRPRRADALLRIGARRFDLVILDLMLPEMSGFEVARRARAAGNYVPILILTAKDDPADVVRGLEEGADDYLTKPFRSTSCWRACARCCGGGAGTASDEPRQRPREVRVRRRRRRTSTASSSRRRAGRVRAHDARGGAAARAGRARGRGRAARRAARGGLGPAARHAARAWSTASSCGCAATSKRDPVAPAAHRLGARPRLPLRALADGADLHGSGTLTAMTERPPLELVPSAPRAIRSLRAGLRGLERRRRVRVQRGRATSPTRPAPLRSPRSTPRTSTTSRSDAPEVRVDDGVVASASSGPPAAFRYGAAGTRASWSSGIAIEPHLRWRALLRRRSLELARDLGVRRAVLLGAYLADVALLAAGRRLGLRERRRAARPRIALEPSRYEGPTGIVGVLGTTPDAGGRRDAEPVGRAAALHQRRRRIRAARSRCSQAPRQLLDAHAAISRRSRRRAASSRRASRSWSSPPTPSSREYVRELKRREFAQ